MPDLPAAARAILEDEEDADLEAAAATVDTHMGGIDEAADEDAAFAADANAEAADRTIAATRRRSA